MREKQEFNYNIFDTLWDGVAVIDGDQNLIYCNQGLANSCNLPLKRLRKGKSINQFFTFSEPAFENLKTINSQTAYSEYDFESKGGNSGRFQVTVQPEASSKGNDRWIVFFRDVTLEIGLSSKYHGERKEKEQAIVKSKMDALTCIYNKGALTEYLNEIFYMAKERDFKFSLLLFDLDNFKRVNDTYGHQAGDKVLKKIAAVIKADILRSSDFFARYGGEEFVIILDRCDIKSGTRIAERIRQTIENTQFSFKGDKVNLTLSIGVAELNDNMSSPDEIIEKADEAAYQSKKKGKNTVSIAA